MREIRVNVKRESTYSIKIQKGLIHQLDRFQEILNSYSKAVIITDTNVAHHYLKLVKDSLKTMVGSVYEIVVEAGEQSKSLSSVKEIYEKLLEFNISRSDVVIALGGGVVGDLSGYCASTFLRGIDFIQIPTSLLAQVDSSVGGKVGVNLDSGKNLVGSFYQPKLVIIDPSTLNTLAPRVFADGMAEVIKYGCIYDEALFTRLLNLDKSKRMVGIEELIETCCLIKKEIVQEDEREKGLRRILNFGHTLGHVVESYYNYEKYSHGEGVALGMLAFSRLGEKKGITKEGTSELLKEILLKYDLPVNFPDLHRDKVMSILYRDKKFEGSHIHLVLIKKIGLSTISTISKVELEEYIFNGRD